MSGNHNQSLIELSRLLRLLPAGAHAIKLQTYTADTMTLDVRGGSFGSRIQILLWSGKNLHDLYKPAYTLGLAQADHGSSQELGLICFSSPFWMSLLLIFLT